MINDIKEIFFTPEQIGARIRELGMKISNDYQSDPPLLVGILKGALPFLADLMRVVSIPVIYDVMAVSSYGASTKSTGTVRIIKDLDVEIENRNVIIVEDIVDTGLTLQYLVENLRSRRPKTLKVCTLLDKPSRRVTPIQPDYNGFEIPDVFVVGFGLDYAEKYRNLPFIGVLKEEIYQND
jgi:hypoxanthine phosphoribosyltransferase